MNEIKVREAFLRGKDKNQSLCEDGYYIGENIIAVIDGATSKSNVMWDGMSSGRYATKEICEALQRDIPISDPFTFFSVLSEIMLKNRKRHGACNIEDWPRASLIVYIRDYNEVWSYGDCRCRIGQNVYLNEKIIDQHLSRIRCDFLSKALKEHSIDELRKDDLGRKAIFEELINQLEYENTHIYRDGIDYGYPVLNGGAICRDMIRIYSLGGANNVVLATDGYPIVGETLEISEQELRKIIEKDPLCCTIYKGTKGVHIGDESYDDRTYIRLSVNKCE